MVTENSWVKLKNPLTDKLVLVHTFEWKDKDGKTRDSSAYYNILEDGSVVFDARWCHVEEDPDTLSGWKLRDEEPDETLFGVKTIMDEIMKEVEKIKSEEQKN